MNLLIDIGGTHVRAAFTSDFKTITTLERYRTPKDLKTLQESITQTVRKLTNGDQIQNICLGVPGIVDEKSQIFISIPNISFLNNQAFASILNFEYKTLIVKNDALLATLGEATTGAGKDFNTVVYLTLSTGVGGARVYNKALDPSYNHSEPGHQIINFNGEKYPSCEQSGCLESYVSGTAFERIYKINPKDCTDQNVWNEYAKHLSYGLTNVIAMWAPDVIVLGGSVCNQFDKFITPLLQNLNDINHKVLKVPTIVKSSHMDKAALYGGLWLIEQSV